MLQVISFVVSWSNLQVPGGMQCLNASIGIIVNSIYSFKLPPCIIWLKLPIPTIV